MEASYAGTSLLGPEDLGSLRYGSEHMNITSDPTTRWPGQLAFDDEGVPAEPAPVVEAGRLTGFLTSRETAARNRSGRGGSMRADGWNRMPLVRMDQLHLRAREGTLDDLLADVDDGVYMETNRSWSIDDKRLQLPVRTQIGLGDQERKPSAGCCATHLYGNHSIFWGSLDAVAGRDSWQLYGLTNCGKGQPDRARMFARRARLGFERPGGVRSS